MTLSEIRSRIDEELQHSGNPAAAPEKQVVAVLPDGREVRFDVRRVVEWGRGIRVHLEGLEVTRYVNCDHKTEENGYSYNCPKLMGDDWDELEDPCEGCSHRTWKVVVEKTM